MGRTGWYDNVFKTMTLIFFFLYHIWPWNESNCIVFFWRKVRVYQLQKGCQKHFQSLKCLVFSYFNWFFNAYKDMEEKTYFIIIRWCNAIHSPTRARPLHISNPQTAVTKPTFLKQHTRSPYYWNFNIKINGSKTLWTKCNYSFKF